MKTQDTPASSQEIMIIARGAGIVFVGSILGAGLKYLIQIILARNLGAEVFGLFFLGLTIFKVTEMIAELGLPHGIIRYVSIFHGKKDMARIKGIIVFSIKATFAAGAALGLILFFFSKTISVHIFHKPDLAVVLKFFAVMLPLSAMTTMMVFSTQAFKIMKYKIFVREFLEPAMKIILIAFVFLLGWGLLGVLSVHLFVFVFVSFIAFLFLKKTFPGIIRRTVEPIYENRELLNFSWPLFFVYFAGFLILYTDTLMIGYFKTSQDVGVYSVAHRTAFLVGTAIAAFNSIFAPIISDLYSRRKNHELEKLFKIVTKWIFSFSLPIFLLIVFFSEPILGIFGQEFVPGVNCLVILCAGWLIHSAVGSVGIMISMIGRPKINLFNTSSTLILNITLNLILIPEYGITGAALATALSISLIRIISLLEVYAILKIHPYQKDIFKPMAAGGLGFLSLIAAKYFILNMNATSIIFLVTYAVALYLLGIGEEDKLVLKSIKKKLRSITNP
jgi:O-antigen/teichoic acid export membrane protein